MKKTYDNTIIAWVKDRQLLATINKIVKELKVNFLLVQEEEDIFALPYFFAILDGEYINDKILDDLIEVISNENPKEFAILLTSNTTRKIPSKFKKYFIKAPEEITPTWLKTLIINKKYAINRRKINRRSYDKTIFRTVYILKQLMQNNAVLKLNELCMEFNVSEKTIKRDIELLRVMGDSIEYDKVRGGYVLTFSVTGIRTSID
jgi:hypothetical protein